MKTATAKLHYLRMTARKVRLIANVTRGLSVNEAEAQLLLMPQRAVKPLLKLLRSAVSNAKGLNLDPGKLVIQSLIVDQGPMLKRYLPRARGSASPIQRKMSHVSLILAEGEKQSNRFKILIKKKEKEHAVEGGAKPKREKPESGSEKAEKKPGFMKRVFRRKTAAA